MTSKRILKSATSCMAVGLTVARGMSTLLSSSFDAAEPGHFLKQKPDPTPAAHIYKTGRCSEASVGEQ